MRATSGKSFLQGGARRSGAPSIQSYASGKKPKYFLLIKGQIWILKRRLRNRRLTRDSWNRRLTRDSRISRFFVKKIRKNRKHRFFGLPGPK